MDDGRLLRATLAPLIVALGVAMLCAPLGWSFVMGVAFSAAVALSTSLHRGAFQLPARWLIASAVFVGFVCLDAIVTQLGRPDAAVPSVKAAVALIVSLVLYFIAFAYGSVAGRQLEAILAVFVVVRLATSVFLPQVSVALRPYLDGRWGSESYQVLGLGIRYVLPGDIAILVAWLYPVVAGVRVRLQWLRSGAVLLAAIASFSRFVVASLIVLMSLRTLISWIRGRKWVRLVGTLATLAFVALLAARFVMDDERLSRIVTARVLASSSNDEKVIQYQMFSDAVTADYGSLLFGSGLGEFMEQHVREPDSPFQYEAQIPSFAYQLGVIGLFLWLTAILVPFLIVNSRLANVGIPPERRLLVVAAGLLLVTGSFFNPLLMLPQNVVLFAALGSLYRRGVDLVQPCGDISIREVRS